MRTEEHWFKSHLKEISREECLALLRSGQVGRVAFNDDAGPMVLPVNYAVDGEDLLIATSPFGSLARSGDGPVAFEVDDVDDFHEAGWSVVVRGRATRVGYDELPDERRMPYPWAEGTRTAVLRITPVEITGRRLIPA